MAPSRRCLLATVQEGTCLVSSLTETHPGSTTQMLQEHATRLFRAPSMRMAAMMPPLTSGSWSGASTATVLKGSRQVGVSTDSHPEVLLHSFQTFTWVCPAGGPGCRGMGDCYLWCRGASTAGSNQGVGVLCSPGAATFRVTEEGSGPPLGEVPIWREQEPTWPRGSPQHPAYWPAPGWGHRPAPRL